jgi:hypothetical protein
MGNEVYLLEGTMSDEFNEYWDAVGSTLFRADDKSAFFGFQSHVGSFHDR